MLRYLSVPAVIFLFAGIVQSHAQQRTWLNYTNGRQVTALANRDDTLWIGTTHGLVHLTKSTGKRSYFNKGNSELSSNHIRDLAMDSSGVLWGAVGIEGWNGVSAVVRYGEGAWSVHNMSPGTAVSVAVDGSNNLWGASSQPNGIWRSDGTTPVSRYDSLLNPKRIECDLEKIVIDRNGDRWVMCDEGRFQRLSDKPRSDDPHSRMDSISEKIHTIFPDREGNIWFGTSKGLDKYDGNKWTSYTTGNSTIPLGAVTAISQDQQGYIWMAGKNVVARFNGTGWIWRTAATIGVPDFEASTMTVDEKGIVWVGTDNGLLRYDPASPAMGTMIDTWNAPLPGNGVSSIAVDRKGVCWIGTYDGVARYDGSWQTYTRHNSSLPEWGVTCVAIDRSDAVLFGIKGGVAKFDGSRWTVWTLHKDSYVASIAVERNGRYWALVPVNEFESRIFMFDGATWITIDTSNSPLPYYGITAMTGDDSGNIWFATGYKKIFRFDGLNWTEYETPLDGEDFNWIEDIIIDHSGAIWVVLRDHLMKFDGSSWKQYPHPFFDEGITTMCATPDNRLWVGVRWLMGAFLENGSDSWNMLDHDNSRIPGTSVYAIAVDSAGNTWFGTDQGIAVYNAGGVASVPQPPLRHDPAIGTPAHVRSIPNPFSSGTTIEYRVEGEGPVTVELVITDIYGNEVAVLVRGEQRGGSYSIPFSGDGLPSGTYFCRLRAGESSMVERLELLR